LYDDQLIIVRPPMTEVSLVTRSWTLKYGCLSPNAAARPRRCSSSCTSGKSSIRQVDSSLLDEWEALTDPDHASREVKDHAPPPPPRPLSQQGRVFEVMVRNAMWRRVDLVARDDLDALAALEDGVPDADFSRADWDAAIEDYYAEHDRVLTDGDARGPDLLSVERGASSWRVTQTLHDPAGHHDWVIEAEVDLAASDDAGEAVVRTLAMRRL